jgi:2-oxoglutarate ferredoxin oxidoreductase subunit gamma
VTIEPATGAILSRGISIRLAGESAHGLLFAGYVLAEAALLERRQVSHLPTLGAAARGPLSGGTLRIAGDPDEDPVVDEADCLLVTSAAALARFARPAPWGLLVAEESLTGLPEHAIAFPIVRTAIESGGTPLVVDLVSAAVVTELTGAVSRRALQDAAARLLPERGRPAGLAALDAGMELGKRRARA